MRKILLSILICISILGLVSCGKEPENITEEQHNYAVNLVKDNTDENKSQTNEDYHPIRQDTADIEPFVENFDDVEYIYPTDTDDTFYVNGIPIAQIAPYSFKLDDIIVDVNSSNEKDNLRKTCIDNHIFCQGYTMNLSLSDLQYDTRNSDESLARFVPAIDTFRIGQINITPEQLIRSTDNFANLIYFCNDNFISRKSSNNTDIYSLAVETRDNEYWGTTYIWKFSINDETLEYTQEELSTILSKQTQTEEDTSLNEEFNESDEDINDDVDLDTNVDLNSEIIIEATYNPDNELVYYTFSINKIAHFWTFELMLNKTDYINTGTYENVPYDKDGNEIPLSKIDQYNENEITYQEKEVVETNIVKVPSGTFVTQQNGYDFTYSYIKLKDGSRIGMDSFSFTIHNPNLIKNQIIDYYAN